MHIGAFFIGDKRARQKKLLSLEFYFMNKKIKLINQVVEAPAFLVLNGGASIAAFMWFAYEKIEGLTAAASLATFSVFFFLLLVGYVYSIKVRLENIALRGISEEFFEINQIYRDKVQELFWCDSPETDAVKLLEHERYALAAVCQRIENIFERVISRKCIVTIKLVTVEDHDCFAHTYVRSQDLSLRDVPGRIKYLVGTGENTGFDVALGKRPDGRPPHFFSADLKKDELKGKYFNQRSHYDRYYRSALVVPILESTFRKSNVAIDGGLIGFLCVDTQSVNRLNSGYHLYMLSALASQMYTFMSFMRGKYAVSVR